MQGMGNNRQGVYDGKIAGLYDLEETLGSGHFAVVKLARHVFTGEKVAVKVIDKTKLDEVSKAHLFQEVRCMKLVQHPHVVRLYEVIDTQTKLYLILELGDGGDLYDYIMKHEGGLSENLAKEYFRQIVRAISYCHQLHVVHRDLKPENVVFFEKLGVVKLTDFGFSNKFCPGQKLETSCGSLAYSAPEILLGDSYDAPAVDVWSLGVILYMLVCGQPPFQEANDSETLTMIMDCKYDMPAHVSAGCRRLISTMLVREPEKRSTLQQIAQDVWLLEGAQDHGPEFLPLVSREQVSDDDHNLIIQKMVNGNIATNDEILEALDRNEYNHITATYFLLVERKLRAHRQEQAQRKRPDLNLPVSGASRISPRSRNIIITKPPSNQQQRDAAAANGDSEITNTLLVPSSIHLNVPRTPGIESGQTPRSRKCSIVQEEDDEEELSSCSGREELSTPLNRRGSRSEGRINIAIQDRIAESERLKKDVPIPVSKIVDGISGVTLITSDSNNTKERLGASGRGNNNNSVARQIGDFRPRTAEQLSKAFKLGKLSENPADRSGSVDKGLKSIKDSEIVNTKILCDSSTITIPLSSNTNQTNQITSNVPKYKTMPSPTRPNTILTGAHCLNEIFEEGTDVGSSDSATTTPRPITRQNHFINNRTQSQGAMSTTTTSTSTSSRRSKFHKTRTTSCSSSDASDDDSENRKKRAHKIVDVAKPPIQHRRDSHDDSSDSQDPGNTTATGSTNAQTHIIHITSSSSSSTTTTTTTTTSTSQSSSAHQESTQTSTSGRQSGGGGFRRHRAGRRRAGETRLRESQSLNRITEVQESEISITQLVQTVAIQPPTAAVIIPPAIPKPKGFSARLFHGFRKTEHSHTITTTATTANHHSTSHVHNQNSHHNPNHNNNNNQQNNNNNNSSKTNNNNSSTVNDNKIRIPLQNEPPDDDVEVVLSTELAKALRVSETKNTTSNSTTKKLKILGKYFQVHKKLCIPIPGIFQRGRLYKAQSCGSIVRDKVVHTNPTASRNSTAGIGGGTAGGGGSSTLNPHNSRHSALFSDKGRILRNCLGATRLLGSDGDINQNNDSKKHSTTTNLFSISSATKNCSLSKTTSPIHHLGESALCSSKC